MADNSEAAASWRPQFSVLNKRQSTFGSGQIKSQRSRSCGVSLRAIAVEHLQPFHQVALAPVFAELTYERIAALPSAAGALNALYIGFALDVAEYDIDSGHGESTPESCTNYVLVNIPGFKAKVSSS